MAILLDKNSFSGLEKWLESELPVSIVVYNMVKLITDKKLPFYNVWVDDIIKPSVVVMRADKTKCNISYYTQQLHIYTSSEDDDALIEPMLRSPGVVDVTAKTVVYSADDHIINTARPVLVSMGLTREELIVETYTYVLSRGNNILKCELPEGYTESVVTPQLTSYLNDQWKFKSEQATESMKDILRWGNPSVCVYSEDGTPVSWAIQKFSGFVGNLHVEEGYRGRGIGKFALSRITSLILEKCAHAYTAIERDNVASISLHEKVGYRKCPSTMDFSYVAFYPEVD